MTPNTRKVALNKIIKTAKVIIIDSKKYVKSVTSYKKSKLKANQVLLIFMKSTSFFKTSQGTS